MRVFPGAVRLLQDTLPGKKKLDYLVGSIHFYTYQGGPRGFWEGFQMDAGALSAYTEAYMEMLESGLFLFGAHPDTFGASIGGGASTC